ncbi:MAG: tripartite tricarboxylate transporter TctB family protein [Alphaproteobacteria bacterium]|nr:tripartite tricarboxylate transporter TctB family protein [Alphaproteobacteria bacterium]
MKLRGFEGELILCAVFIGAGAFWVAVAAGMPLWEGFAPASGFLPLLYGVLLTVLAVAATLADVLGRGEAGEARAPVRRPATVLLALAAGVAGIETAGFFASMALAMLFLFRVAERLPIVGSVAAAMGVSAGLTLVFRSWLGVPLPAGPWGF